MNRVQRRLHQALTQLGSPSVDELRHLIETGKVNIDNDLAHNRVLERLAAEAGATIMTASDFSSWPNFGAMTVSYFADALENHLDQGGAEEQSGVGVTKAVLAMCSTDLLLAEVRRRMK